MGAGRTELAMSVFGRAYGRNIRGTATLEGRKLDLSTIEKAIAQGLAYVTEDRKVLGLVLTEEVRTNITLANLEGVSHTRRHRRREGSDGGEPLPAGSAHPHAEHLPATSSIFPAATSRRWC